MKRRQICLLGSCCSFSKVCGMCAILQHAVQGCLELNPQHFVQDTMFPNSFRHWSLSSGGVKVPLFTVDSDYNALFQQMHRQCQTAFCCFTCNDIGRLSSLLGLLTLRFTMCPIEKALQYKIVY